MAKRILQILPGNMNMGGIERFLMELYKNINRTEYQFDFIVHSKEKNYFEDDIKSLGGKIYHLCPKAKHIIKYKKELTSILADYDIVHIHASYSFAYFEAKWAKNLNKSVIVHSHSSKQTGKKLFLHKLLKRRLNKFVDIKCAVSSKAAEFMFEDITDVQYIFGFDINKFTFSNKNRKIIRTKLKINDNQYLIGCIARMDDQKDPLFTYEIFSNLVHEKDIQCVFIGDGKYKQQLINDNQSDAILFIGNVKHPELYLSALDAYILPTKYEGIGTSLIEAEINGLRTYSSKEGTPFEIKISKKLDILDKNSPQTWSNKILQDKFINKNYSRIEKISDYSKFNIKKCAKDMQKIYDHLVKID